MRRIIGVVLLVLIWNVTCAQHQGYTPVQDIAAFKTEFSEKSKQVTSIKSDFTQVKELLALTEKLTSTGKFWFKRSNLVRIDYEKPFRYRMIMNGERIHIKDEGKENTINVKSNKLFQQVNRIMLDCIQGTITESKDFSTRVFENDKAFLLELTPSGKGLKEFFSTILLFVDRRTYAVDTIEMREAGGDNTKLMFTKKALNQPVGDEVFAF